MSTSTVNPEMALRELARRARPKDHEHRAFHVIGRRGQEPELVQASTLPTFGLTGADLRTLAQPAAKAAARKAKATQAKAQEKPARVTDPNTALRAQAWAWRMAERKAGRKVSYADACAKFGTTPAKG